MFFSYDEQVFLFLSAAIPHIYKVSYLLYLKHLVVYRLDKVFDGSKICFCSLIAANPHGASILLLQSIDYEGFVFFGGLKTAPKFA